MCLLISTSTYLSGKAKRAQFLILASLMTVSCFAQGNMELESEIRAVAKTFGGRVGVAAKNISTGEMIDVDADSSFPTASAIKLPVLVELYQRFHDGLLSPHQPVMLKEPLRVPGNGVLQFMQEGQSIQLVDLGTLMIIISDNTATNYVIDHLGTVHDDKLHAVNQRMRLLGLRRTKLLNKLYSFSTKKNTDEARRFGIGVSSPEDMVILLEKLVRGEVASKGTSDSIIAILRHQTDKEMASRWLPSAETDTTFWIANKTGSLDDRKIDVGIVSRGKTVYVYAIFCDQSTELGEMPDNRTILAIARVSRLLYTHFVKD